MNASYASARLNEGPVKRNADLVVVAAARWVDAVNAPQDATRLERACAPEMTVERMGVFDKKGRLAETFEGADAVSEWLGRLPKGVFFELAGGPQSSPDVGAGVWMIRYLYRIPELHFSNGGSWLFKLTDEGRLSWLRHDPDPLPGAMSAGGRDQGGQDHDHDHH